MDFAHVRYLSTYETKKRLLDRFKSAINEPKEYQHAIKNESRIDENRRNVEFSRVDEDVSVQHTVSVLDLLLNAKEEYNGEGNMNLAATRSIPTKVKLNTQSVSGKSRDFAMYKK